MALARTPEFEFRRRYRLAPTDPRFLACTQEEILLDIWAHRFWDDPKLEQEEINEDFGSDVAEFFGDEEDEEAPEAAPDATEPEPVLLMRPEPGEEFDTVTDLEMP